jgi:anaerobic ribonucleoside-triphosphate reductase activating protein
VINIRYAQIREMDISNGEGIGVSLFVQGCHFHCKNCFNKDTWDFNGGKEWTEEVKNKFIKLINKPYVKRVSILGGEPLADENVVDVLNLIKEIKTQYPCKTIWLYSGYLYEQIDTNIDTDENMYWQKRRDILYLCDVLVDGKFQEELADVKYPWAGSTNQRVIDIKKSLEQDEVVLWCD